MRISTITLIASLALLGASFGMSEAQAFGKGKDRAAGFLAKMDTDGDGQVSAAEHSAASQERFKKLDADGNGFITQDEFRQKMSEMKQKRVENKAQNQENSVE